MTAGQDALDADLRAGTSVKEALLRRAIADLGPFVFYPTGEVADRRTGQIVWRPGDPPERRPRPIERGYSDKRHNSGYFGGWR
ncbi:MAG: hypothetical protein KGI98_11900 [Euryarchaeota archaeon]|nr:hypothetical protein [Euryarchaeota archaeon]MDE1881593.1 hypothetical protein [Euryarchaeota archaeon]